MSHVRGLGAKAVAFVAAVVLALPVVVSSPSSAEGGESLRWGQCPDLGTPVPGLECAVLAVPLDYRRPAGPAIEIAVSRLRSTDPAKRRGVLLTNPGGPGGPGLTLPVALVNAGVPGSVRESYDLIGFDPRGVGHSTPVTCDLPPERLTSNVPPYARTRAEVRQQAEVVRDTAHRCATSATAPLLPYITTANTARDMDRIRAALGERRMSYFGLSYGTYLGAVYATLFPDRTDRIVLDSTLGPGGLDVTASRRLALGFSDRFPDFAAWAADRDSTYGLGATPAAVTATYFELANRLDQAPVGGVDGKLFRLSTFGALYNDRNFPPLAQLWQAVKTEAAPMPNALLAQQPVLQNLLSAQLHVICNDSDWPESIATYERNVEHDRIRLPMFGAAAANIWPCAFWPVNLIEPPVRITGRGPSDILMVQNLRDPATPLAGAREMRAALGHRARLVKVDNGGHGVYLGTNTCANDAVTTFLTQGQRPPRDSFCAKQPPPTQQRPTTLPDRTLVPHPGAGSVPQGGTAALGNVTGSQLAVR
jgi:pimeloyl-ACP methyl ester carboxylesterase